MANDIQNEAEKPTDVKDKTGIDWDNIFDEPAGGELSTDTKSSSLKPSAGAAEVPHMKIGSAADTAKATAKMSPTDAMRDMMSRINVPVDDTGVDEPTDNLPSTQRITPEHLPAVISREIAMTDPHAVNPTWHTVANLPGNMSRAILTLGKALFRAFTRTPTEDIVMIGNVGGQGPNTTREVRSVANWVVEHGRPVDTASIDFGATIPGYRADVKHYVVGGIRFKIVKDQFGDYIYCWPEADSIGATPQIGNKAPAQEPVRRPSRSLPRR